MASSQVSPGVIPQPSFAGLERRLPAFLIDLFVAGAVVVAAAFIVRELGILGVWIRPMTRVAEPWSYVSPAYKLLCATAYIVAFGPFYLGFFEASAWQASIGKRLLGIYVIDLGGSRLSLGKSFRRSFTKCVLNGFYIGAVSFFTIPLTAEREAWHDHVIKTRVVRGRPANTGSPEAWRILGGFGRYCGWSSRSPQLFERCMPTDQHSLFGGDLYWGDG